MTTPEQPPQDYAEILRRQYAEMKTTDKPRFRMSDRNRRKLQKIREKVQQLRNQ